MNTISSFCILYEPKLLIVTKLRLIKLVSVDQLNIYNDYRTQQLMDIFTKASSVVFKLFQMKAYLVFDFRIGRLQTTNVFLRILDC